MQRREDWMFFYEKVDWMGVADFLSAYFGDGGILISVLLKLISIWVISPLMIVIPLIVVVYIISRVKGVFNEKRLHKFLSSSQK